jgi:hypothetical protein
MDEALQMLATIITKADPETAQRLRDWRKVYVVELNGAMALNEFLLSQNPRVMQWHLDELLRRTALETRQFVRVTTDLRGEEPYCDVVSRSRLLILRQEADK